jgi:hypothetical protein
VAALVSVSLFAFPALPALLLGDDGVAWLAGGDHQVRVGCLLAGDALGGDGFHVVGFGCLPCTAGELQPAHPVVAF